MIINPLSFMELVLHKEVAHNGSPDFQICYIALRKDGEVGAACLKWAFPHLVTVKGRTTLRSIKGMLAK